MKKFYLLATAVLMAGASQAASLAFLNGETPVANGETVTFTNYKVEEYPTDVDVVFEPETYLTADYNTGAITLTAVSTSGQEFQICAGGLCEIAKEITKNVEPLAANAKVDLQLHYTASQVLPEDVEKLEDCVVVLSATDDTDPSTAANCTFIFSTNKAGIKAIEYGKNVAVANGRIAYALNSTEALRVYSLAGNTVAGATVEGNGTFDISNLAPGVYVYTLGTATGKFVVR